MKFGNFKGEVPDLILERNYLKIILNLRICQLFSSMLQLIFPAIIHILR